VVTQTGRAASVKDVAAAAGVSLGTVSNVLNRPDRVSAATRARVQAAMTDLGFVRNESARQLRAGTSRTLAYVMLDASNPFFTDVAQGIESAADAAELSLVLCNSGNGASREEAHLALLQQQRVQGVLVTPVDPESPLLEEVRRRGTPLVIVDRTRDDQSFCSVAVDDQLGGRLAVEHLLDRGHTRVAFIGGPLHLGQVRDRLEGARQAWADAGMPEDDLVVLATEALDVREGRSAGQRLAGLPSSPAPRPPSAPTTCSPSACSSRRSAPASGSPSSSPSWATTTSSSRPRPPYPSPPCGSPARSWAAPPPSWSSTRRPTPPTSTTRSCSPPSSWPAPPPWTEAPGLRDPSLSRRFSRRVVAALTVR